MMVKEPRPGRVKTRLGAEIGMVPAAWWFRHQSRALIRRLCDPRWQLVLAVAPDVAGLRSRVWPADLARVPQGPGSLGDRMGRQIRAAKGPVCVIGADIPGIRPRHIAGAFAALGGHDAVFGPAFDGGYWLVGWARGGQVPAGFLDNVRWSTQHALADSTVSVPGRSVALAECLRDVDSHKDLQQAEAG